MRSLLTVFFSSILLGMLAITTYASLDRGLFDAGSELLEHPWFVATLCDAYFGFLTFYVWVWYRESTAAARTVWFVLIMLLGNIAMSVYVLRCLYRLPPDARLTDLLHAR